MRRVVTQFSRSQLLDYRERLLSLARSNQSGEHTMMRDLIEEQAPDPKEALRLRIAMVILATIVKEGIDITGLRDVLAWMDENDSDRVRLEFKLIKPILPNLSRTSVHY